jgi:hypothetical protein
MTTRLRISLALALTLCAFTVSATADPYWVAWEGNDFPENEGWERIVNGPQPAERTLADGIMTMDGLADTQIDDYYRMDRPLDPELGEEFVMQWRLRVDEIIGHPLGLWDPGLSLFSDDDWALTFVLGTDFIRCCYEDVDLPFEPGAFHVFEVRSWDMRTYQLRMDQVLMHIGTFWEPSFESSRIQWGDYTRGSASLVDWDYFRFGVVPEPNTGLLLSAFLSAHRAVFSRRSTK